MARAGGGGGAAVDGRRAMQHRRRASGDLGAAGRIITSATCRSSKCTYEQQRGRYEERVTVLLCYLR